MQQCAGPFEHGRRCTITVTKQSQCRLYRALGPSALNCDFLACLPRLAGPAACAVGCAYNCSVLASSDRNPIDPLCLLPMQAPP